MNASKDLQARLPEPDESAGSDELVEPVLHGGQGTDPKPGESGAAEAAIPLARPEEVTEAVKPEVPSDILPAEDEPENDAPADTEAVSLPEPAAAEVLVKPGDEVEEDVDSASEESGLGFEWPAKPETEESSIARAPQTESESNSDISSRQVDGADQAIAVESAEESSVDPPTRAASRRSRRAVEYDARAADLEALLRTSTMRFDPKVVASGLVDLEIVRGRLALGVDSTVVAFAGGTGSGKSSLFNAISGVRFADVGVRRPTTSQVTACYWGPPVEPLLDWLEILPRRRHQRESILDADDETEMHGLVLLDLPDHDSIVDTNRFEVDRLLPKIDLLIWVVDPQKYADQALHAGYLQDLVGHEGSLLVLLNQADTLPEDAVEPVLHDIERLLAEDGLSEIPVVPVSAKTGSGLPWVRDRIEKVVSRASKCAERADAALTIAANRLEDGLGESNVTLADLPVQATRAELAAAAGVEQLAESAGLQRIQGVKRSPTPPVHVQSDRVERARTSMIEAASVGLPSYWVEYLDVVLTDADTISGEISKSLQGAIAPVRRSVWRRSCSVLTLLCAAGVLAGMVWLLLIATGVVAGAPGIGTSLTAVLGVSYELPVVIVLGALVLMGAMWWLRARVGRSAARNAHKLRKAELEAAIEKVVDSRLVGVVNDVLKEHRDIRERLPAIAGEPIRATDVADAVDESLNSQNE